MATAILRPNAIRFSTVYESNGDFLYTPDLDVDVLAHPDVLISALRDLKLQSKAADQWFTTNVLEKDQKKWQDFKQHQADVRPNLLPVPSHLLGMKVHDIQYKTKARSARENRTLREQQALNETAHAVMDKVMPRKFGKDGFISGAQIASLHSEFLDATVTKAGRKQLDEHDLSKWLKECKKPALAKICDSLKYRKSGNKDHLVRRLVHHDGQLKPSRSLSHLEAVSSKKLKQTGAMGSSSSMDSASSFASDLHVSAAQRPSEVASHSILTGPELFSPLATMEYMDVGDSLETSGPRLNDAIAHLLSTLSEHWRLVPEKLLLEGWGNTPGEEIARQRPHRVASYLAAAANIRVSQLHITHSNLSELNKVKSVGKHIRENVQEFFSTGTLSSHRWLLSSPSLLAAVPSTLPSFSGGVKHELSPAWFSTNAHALDPIEEEYIGRLTKQYHKEVATKPKLVPALFKGYSSIVHHTQDLVAHGNPNLLHAMVTPLNGVFPTPEDVAFYDISKSKGESSSATDDFYLCSIAFQSISDQQRVRALAEERGLAKEVECIDAALPGVRDPSVLYCPSREGEACTADSSTRRRDYIINPKRKGNGPIPGIVELAAELGVHLIKDFDVVWRSEPRIGDVKADDQRKASSESEESSDVGGSGGGGEQKSTRRTVGFRHRRVLGVEAGLMLLHGGVDVLKANGQLGCPLIRGAFSDKQFASDCANNCPNCKKDGRKKNPNCKDHRQACATTKESGSPNKGRPETNGNSVGDGQWLYDCLMCDNKICDHNKKPRRRYGHKNGFKQFHFKCKKGVRAASNAANIRNVSPSSSMPSSTTPSPPSSPDFVPTTPSSPCVTPPLLSPLTSTPSAAPTPWRSKRCSA